VNGWRSTECFGRPLNFTSKDFTVVSSVLRISGSFDCRGSLEREGQTA
jgi:hypothetical protein